MKRSDGQNYKYVWDAFGRLRQVRKRGNNDLVAEYRYNGLGFRISEHYDTDTDGDVDGDDSIYHFVYDERWRIVSTSVNDDDATDPKELFVHYCAGAGGCGSLSNFDAVILRDVDFSTAWNAEHAEPADSVRSAERVDDLDAMRSCAGHVCDAGRGGNDRPESAAQGLTYW